MKKIDENFEVEKSEGSAQITMRGFVCMYAGDRGTEVWPQQTLDKRELLSLIVKLIKLWRSM